MEEKIEKRVEEESEKIEKLAENEKGENREERVKVTSKIKKASNNYRNPELIQELKYYSIFSLIAFAIIIVLTAISTKTVFTGVIIGLSPTLFTILIVFLSLERRIYPPPFYWATSFALIIVFYIFSKMGIMGNLNAEGLGGANFILSVIFLFVFNATILYRGSGKKKVKEGKPKEIEEYIHSIEDKCKAINFVIGRVYSSYHGGSSKLRDKIKIPSELYNEFNSIEEKDLKKKWKTAKILVLNIQHVLDRLYEPEKAVFGDEAKKLVNLERDKEGNDSIIDVLAKNDKDPVYNYVEGALDFCKRALEEIEGKK